MSIIFSLAGIITFVLLILIFAWGVRSTALGALSLPCIMALTSFIYFFLMPISHVISGNASFFGLVLDDLDGVYLAVGLYALGAMAAMLLNRRILSKNPVDTYQRERTINLYALFAILALAISGVAAKVMLGLLNIGDDTDVSSSAINVNFLQLSDSLLISTTLVVLLIDRFRFRSLALLAFTVSVFVLDGFRFRIVILLSAALISFAISKGIRIRSAYVFFGGIIAIIVLNAIGLSRSYGSGIDLSRLGDRSLGELFGSFDAEIGPVFVLQHLTDNPPYNFIGLEPWYVAVTRFIPAFMWPNKPFPDYLLYYAWGFPDRHALTAGVAGTQQSEFFLQFGFLGLPFLAFGYYALALRLQRRLLFLSREARIAGTAILPAMIGFYSQQRGYTFQLLCELFFTLFPLFVMHWGISSTRVNSGYAGESLANSTTLTS